MCGIAGIISYEGINRDDILNMSANLSHRGPDGFGYLLFSPKNGVKIVHNEEPPFFENGEYTLCLIHRRLSIIDLSKNAIQPMADSAESVIVVYNGEIYNYIEIRKELEELGCIFKTDSDTEVLLIAYKHWGIECVKKFNGMWAFVLADIPNKRIYFSRDRFGIKPFYYSLLEKKIIFSSEIKSILSATSSGLEPNSIKVAEYLFSGTHDDSYETFFKNIINFPASHNASIAFPDNDIEINLLRYWSIPNFYSDNLKKGINIEVINDFRDLFMDSLKLHGRSDVKIGTCLSGGLDSSSIVCTASYLHKQNFLPNLTHNAFGYCANDEKISEYGYMKEVVDKTNIKLSTIRINKQEFDRMLPHIVKIQDEPFGSIGIIAQWFVFNKAHSDGIKVMMDGQGADEILGGYHGYYQVLGRQLLITNHLKEFFIFYLDYKRLFGLYPLSFYEIMKNFIPHPVFNVLNHVHGLCTKKSQITDSNNNYLRCFCPSIAKQIQSKPINDNRNENLDAALKYSIQTYSMPSLLRYEDRNSMANSIEARVPFLDYRLVEFLFSLPYQYKINGATTKFILRESMHSLLPEQIRKRVDKLGFKADPALLFSYVRDNFHEIIENQTNYEKEWFDKGQVEQFIRRSLNEEKNEDLVWRIVNMKLWLRQQFLPLNYYNQ